MELGSKIKYLRTKRHWTQFELAGKANLTRSHISQLENNRILNPGVAAIRSLAKVFEVSEDILLLPGQPDIPTNQFSESKEGKSRVDNQSSLILDPELRQWLTLQILNWLNPDIIRAIIAIIRDGVGQVPHQEEEKHSISVKSAPDEQKMLDDPSQFLANYLKNPPIRDYSSLRFAGDFILAG